MATNSQTENAAQASLTDKARRTASEIAEQGKQSATALAEDAKVAAKERADAAKSSVAGEVSGVASALRSAADEMRSGSPQERTFGQIAESLADVSDAMREKDLGTMVEDVSQFARRNPLVFLGGAALLGFAATRFAKASQTTTSAQAHGHESKRTGDFS